MATIPDTLGDLDALFAGLPAGANLVMHSGCAEPPGLAAQLALSAPRLRDAHLYTLMPMAKPVYADAAAAGRLTIHSFFPGHGLRAAVASGGAEQLRLPLSAIPGRFQSRAIRVDLLLLQVSPPDSDGRVSLGISVDYMPAVIAQRPTIVAEINPAMPRTRGQSTLPAAAIDFVIEGHGPVQSFRRVEPDRVERQIAGNIASLVRDGAVLQAGIGAIPETVMGLLTDRRGLGMHSGIVTDPVMQLLRSGALDTSGSRRPVVTTIAAGTAEFYAFLDDNPQFAFLPCDTTHGHAELAAIDGLCAINGALQVDLAGRVNAEVIGGRTVSAPGGLPDFARGASAAKGGQSIIALRSTSRDGRHSAILPALADAVPVTVEPEHVGWVVTEHGSARLAGGSALQRAQALIAVADPQFRAWLRRGGD